jgi:hypothetical protein
LIHFLIVLAAPIIALAVGYLYGCNNIEPDFDWKNDDALENKTTEEIQAEIEALA